jgi:hypothetical protein
MMAAERGLMSIQVFKGLTHGAGLKAVFRPDSPTTVAFRATNKARARP